MGGRGDHDGGPPRIACSGRRTSKGVRAAAADVFGVSADQVLVGNGSDDCLTIIMRSFVLPGDLVACPWPTYSLYDTLATIQAVKITHVDWLQEADSTLEGSAAAGGVPGWHMPVDALAKSGARVVFVATPNNPSGPLHGRLPREPRAL